MTEFKIGDRVRYTGAYESYGGEGWVGVVVRPPAPGDRVPTAKVRWTDSPGTGDRPAEVVFPGNIERVTPDCIVPLTPEEEGITSTIREPELLPAFERALAERKDAFEHKVVLLFEEAEASLLSKHHDYGPLNIARSPGGPLNGLRVRLWDKTARLNHLIDTGATPENESLEDTFRDMLGYSAIGLLVLRGDWPDE